MSLSQWFETQLQASADGFIWAVEQVPDERLYAPPPGPGGGLGEWVAARHLFHLLYYERHAALPAMRSWLLGEAQPSFEGYDEDASWAEAPTLAAQIEQFRAVRAEQIALLPRIGAALWEESRETGWGDVTLRWVVAKTYQHTAEHISDVLRIALFWDVIEAYNRRQQEGNNVDAN